MPDITAVHTDTLHGVAHDITVSAGTTFEAAERLRNLPAPAGHAFGNGAGGQAAHAEYLRVHQELTDRTSEVGARLALISAAMRQATDSFQSARTSAVDAISRQG
ncbi:hypothetical protein [Streptomyces sp. NPDC001068]|uniref:hypothetical protein n=1 Tax=Streptomyces sp. NPDC001068 TaxID=3364544 RepID=UPI0036736C93